MTWRGIASRILARLPPRSRLYWTARYMFFGRRAVFNLSHSESSLDAVADQQFNLAFQAIGDRLPSRVECILDFGAGANRYSSRLGARFDCRVLAVDIVEGYARHYAGAANVDYRCSMDGKIPAPDRSTDLIWCFLVLGGLPDKLLPQVAREFRRVLRPGGMLVLVENIAVKPSAPHWSYRSVACYQTLFQGWAGAEVGRFTDVGEEVAIMLFKADC